MKIKSLLSVIACGLASQFMVGCASSGQFYDFSVPTAAHQKVAPQTPVTTIAPADAPAHPVQENTVASLPLEASMARPVASARVARTAPLTTQAVASTVPASTSNSLSNVLTAASSNKTFTNVSAKLKRDAKSGKKANAINGYIKIGLVLILAGVLIGILPKLAVVGSIVAVVGVVFLVLGLLEML